MRIAVVSPHVVYPATSGDRLRNAHLLEQLVLLGHDVHLVRHSWPDERPEPPPSGVTEHIVPGRPVGAVGGLAWRARLAATRLRDPFALFSWGPARAGLVARIQAICPDVVDFQHAFMWAPTGFPDVVTMVDVESRRTGSEASANSRQIDTVERVERAALEAAAAVVVLSERDRERCIDVAADCAPRVHVVELGHRPSRAGGHPIRPELATLALVGSYDYGPNRDAAEDLVALGPRLAAVGVARLLVVGRAAATLELSPPPGSPAVEVRSDVADVADAVLDADALIVTLRSGGGVRVKIIEAWALGLPVVSTALGIEGLGATDGVDAMIAPDLAGLVDCVRRMASVEVRRGVAESGLRMWAERYDPAAMGTRMATIYQSLLT